MNHARILILVLVSWLVSNTYTQAQQDAQFTLFNFNQLYFNPAMAGADGVTRFQLLNRLQWQGYQTSSGDGGAPNTLMFSAAAPLNFIKSAVGIHYLNDRLGATGSQEFQLSYAYRLNINENTLAIGARAGFISRFIDFGRLTPREQGDPLIPAGRIAQTRPDITVGAYYDAASYYVGLSVNHLNRASYDFTATSAENSLSPNAYLTAGYRWEPLYGLEVQPMILLKSPLAFSAQTLSLEGGVMATWNETFFGGVTYRMGDAYNVLLGVDWRSFRLGGAIDLTGIGRTAKQPASYEVLLSYSLPAPSLNKKKIVRTPRFRY